MTITSSSLITIVVVLLTVSIISYLILWRKLAIRRAGHSIVKITEGIYSGPHNLRIARLGNFPNLDENYYNQTMSQLLQQGFTLMGDAEDATLNQQLPRLRTMIRFMASGDGSIRTGFWNLVTPPSKGQTVNRNFKSIEFVTEFSDGHYVFTGNSQNAVNEPPKEFDLVRMRADTPLDDLLQTHRDRVSSYAATNPNGASIIKFYSLDDIFASYQRATAVIAKQRKAIGYITRDELRKIARMSGSQNADTVMDEIENERKKEKEK